MSSPHATKPAHGGDWRALPASTSAPSLDHSVCGMEQGYDAKGLSHVDDPVSGLGGLLSAASLSRCKVHVIPPGATSSSISGSRCGSLSSSLATTSRQLSRATSRAQSRSASRAPSPALSRTTPRPQSPALSSLTGRLSAASPATCRPQSPSTVVGAKKQPMTSSLGAGPCVGGGDKVSISNHVFAASLPSASPRPAFPPISPAFAQLTPSVAAVVVDGFDLTPCSEVAPFSEDVATAIAEADAEYMNRYCSFDGDDAEQGGQMGGSVESPRSQIHSPASTLGSAPIAERLMAPAALHKDWLASAAAADPMPIPMRKEWQQRQVLLESMQRQQQEQQEQQPHQRMQRSSSSMPAHSGTDTDDMAALACTSLTSPPPSLSTFSSCNSSLSVASKKKAHLAALSVRTLLDETAPLDPASPVPLATPSATVAAASGAAPRVLAAASTTRGVGVFGAVHPDSGMRCNMCRLGSKAACQHTHTHMCLCHIVVRL